MCEKVGRDGGVTSFFFGGEASSAARGAEPGERDDLGPGPAPLRRSEASGKAAGGGKARGGGGSGALAPGGGGVCLEGGL